MRKSLFSMAAWAFGAAMVTSVGYAAPSVPACATGASLQSYIDLSSTGCQIDDKIFSNFAYGGLSSPTASQVLVTVDTTPFNPGLHFGANWIVTGANQSADFHLSFTIDVLQGGFPIDDDSLGIDFGRIAGSGLINVNETVCLGGNFANPSGGTGCTNPVSVLQVFGSSASQTTFAHDIYTGGATYTHLQVFKDIGLSTGAGTDSAANFSSLSQNFSEVPEPMTFSLMGAGLLGLGLLRKRIS